MSDENFVDWVKDFRRELVKMWDETGTPPRIGYSKEDLTRQLQKLYQFPVSKMLVSEDGKTEKDCIQPVKTFAAATDQFFPHMFKTKINYGNNLIYSIYDFLSDDRLLARYLRLYSFRHFMRDSYYFYSRNIRVDNKAYPVTDEPVTDGLDYIRAHERYTLKHHCSGNIPEYWYWLAPVKEKKTYTGFHEEMRNIPFLRIRTEDIPGDIPARARRNINPDAPYHEIRQYSRFTKIFPAGYRTFQTSFAHRPSGFNPAVAKLLIEQLTDKWKAEDPIYVYDPSAGWGGRLAGAKLADRSIFYLGTDPNPDNPDHYSSLSSFIDNEVIGNRLDKQNNQALIFTCGSETIHLERGFQSFKGQISLVFSSPPYFAKEIYSDDSNQSCHKFPAYEDWINKFLKPTLETAVMWLRPGGYIAWNIADIPMASGPIALEQPSCAILECLGMKYVRTYKMILSQMPGQHRTREDDSCAYKNAVKLKGKWTRYEPIFVYRKPV